MLTAAYTDILRFISCQYFTLIKMSVIRAISHLNHIDVLIVNIHILQCINMIPGRTQVENGRTIYLWRYTKRIFNGFIEIYTSNISACVEARGNQ